MSRTTTLTFDIYLRATPRQSRAVLSDPGLALGWLTGAQFDRDEESDPRRLTCEWLQTDQLKANDGLASAVRFEFVAMGLVTRLTVTHQNLALGGSFLKVIEPGWPMIMSSLKSLIETGHPLEFRRSALTDLPADTVTHHLIRRFMDTSIRNRVAAAAAAVTLTAGIAVASATMAGASTTSHPHSHPHPTHSATAAAKPEATKLTIRNRQIAHSRHHAVAITGLLTADNTGVAGQTVVLEARSGKMPRWHAVASAVTTSTGTVTFTVAPKMKTQYQLIFTGDAHFKASESNTVTLK